MVQQVGRQRFGGARTGGSDFIVDALGAERRQADRAGLGYGGSEFGQRNPTQSGGNYRILNSKQVANSGLSIAIPCARPSPGQGRRNFDSRLRKTWTTSS